MGCSLKYVAEDGKKLIDRMKEEKPDIVITDIRMPGADGLAVCQYIYETISGDPGDYFERPILMFVDARAAIKYGVCEYVLKISVLEELPGAVEKAIQNLEKVAKRVFVSQCRAGGKERE